LVGFADSLTFHIQAFCLTGTKMATTGTRTMQMVSSTDIPRLSQLVSAGKLASTSREQFSVR
jgi:hypothetical protein